MFIIDYEGLEARIRQMCVEKGVSVNKMLMDAEVNKSFVDNIKKEREPSAAKLARVAEYLGTSSDYLLGKTDQRNPPSAAPDDISDQLIALYGEVKPYLDEDDREDIAMFMKMKAERKRQKEGK